MVLNERILGLKFAVGHLNFSMVDFVQNVGVGSDG